MSHHNVLPQGIVVCVCLHEKYTAYKHNTCWATESNTCAKFRPCSACSLSDAEQEEIGTVATKRLAHSYSSTSRDRVCKNISLMCYPYHLDNDFMVLILILTYSFSQAIQFQISAHQC